MMRRRAVRQWDEIAASPLTPFMVGRLLGACMMASALLDQEHESANAQKVAAALDSAAAFFLIDVGEERD